MIAKGNLHAHGGKLAAYLITSKDGERAELVQLDGFAADNIRDAFNDVQIQAEATRATKPFFHAYVRLPESDELTRARWQEVADRLELRLGFDGQGRAVAFHHGAAGETHMHVVWSRIDLETMKAIDPGLYKNKMKELCRELEQEFGLTRVTSERAVDDKTRSATRDEFEQSRRIGTNLKEIRTTIRDCWDRSDNGVSFAAALNNEGLILARGDKRDYVVVDRAGGDHALGKRITGATAAETRARLADIDRGNLLRVDEAKQTQQERRPDIQTEEAAPRPFHWAENQGMVAQQQSAMRLLRRADRIGPQQAPEPRQAPQSPPEEVKRTLGPDEFLKRLIREMDGNAPASEHENDQS